MEEKETFIEPIVDVVELDSDVICESCTTECQHEGCTGPNQLEEIEVP
ncbi:MAG: hypothetical protein IJ125_08655 [Atopobiaceae bacterium]|nr:hypothetical protein [Atopobiaceae bacterium]